MLGLSSGCLRPKGDNVRMADPKTQEEKHSVFEAEDYPHHEEVNLPDHFSMISAQTSDQHNEDSHNKLKEDLSLNGFKPVGTDGNYGYDEKSYF